MSILKVYQKKNCIKLHIGLTDYMESRTLNLQKDFFTDEKVRFPMKRNILSFQKNALSFQKSILLSGKETNFLIKMPKNDTFYKIA